MHFNTVYAPIYCYFKCLSAVILSVSFFQLVSIGSFFTEELKTLNNNLIQYLYLFILIYPLQYPKRLAT